MTEMHRMLQLVEQLIHPENRISWMDAPVAALGDKSPVELIAAGKTSVIIDFLEGYIKGELQ